MEKVPNPTDVKPRHFWPWLLLVAFVLGVVLAVIWVGAEVRRTKQRRELNMPASTPRATQPALLWRL